MAFMAALCLTGDGLTVLNLDLSRTIDKEGLRSYNTCCRVCRVSDNARSVGAQRLREALRPKMKAADLAVQLGVTQQAVNAWLTGVAKPSTEHSAQIEDILGIPMRAWTVAGDEEDATGTEG
jgi:DNA-binding transcriptional regulator YiaG